MVSFPQRLSRLQHDLLEAWFQREPRFVLTGGAALAGFHLGHREGQDLDPFARQPVDMDLAVRALEAAAADVGAQVQMLVVYPEFRRGKVDRAEESTLVDLVIDRVPAVEPTPVMVGRIAIDSMREIAANKIGTLVGRAELRDLVDLKCLLEAGVSLTQALADAQTKDGGAEAATLAWLLDQLTIPPTAQVPGGMSAAELDRFRVDLVERLRRMAFPGG